MFNIYETKSQLASEYDQLHEFIVDFIAADDVSPDNSDRHFKPLVTLVPFCCEL